MEQVHPNPGPGQCGSDREVFERVWRRVMPEDRADSPVELFSDVPAPAPPATPPVPTADGSVQPDVQDVPLLGASSAVHGPLLQRCIDGELLSFRRYRALSRRLSGQAARAVAEMAADERRHARRLSAAYFLITGIRYLPPDPSAPASRPDPTPAGALRRAFADEQRTEALYRASAADCADSCLRELFLALAEEESAHRGLILLLLEQAW